jgi:hypothetical protein
MKLQLQNNILKNFLYINRKLHILLGLFLLLFIWIFFFSGLIINHSGWKFAKFYENRKEVTKHYIISFGVLHDDPDMIKRIEAHLGLVGEVSNIEKKEGSIDFRVSSPGLIQEVHVDSKTGFITMKVVNYNFWGKLRTLHLFNGMDRNNAAVTPNWMVTKLWRFMMDLTAVILIILCVGSWIMWYNVRNDYKLGYLFLGVGIAVSGYFVFVIDLL